MTTGYSTIVEFALFQMLLLGIPLKNSNSLRFLIFPRPENGTCIFITQLLLSLASFLGVSPNADPCFLCKPFVQRQKSTWTPKGKGTEGLCPHSGQVLRCSQLSCSFIPRETSSHQYLCRQRRKREERKQRKKKTFPGINNPHYSVDCTSITKSPP